MQEKSQWKAPASMLLYVALVIVLGSLTGLFTMGIPLAAEDPEKWARRCMMLWGAILMWPLLKALRWEGIKESGWDVPPEGPGRLLLVGKGFGMGVGMVLLIFIAVWGGTRYWNLAYAPGKVAVKVFTYAMGAFAVSIIEETAMRGIIFRSLAKAWNTIGAITLIGIVFAAAHFLGPSAEALKSGSVMEVLHSAVTRMTREPDVAVRLLNLFMMNAVLCLLVMKTGNIWMGVGMHAAWVWIKRLNSILADSDETSPLRSWLGTKSDFTNAWICLAVLIGLAIWAWPRKGSAHA